MVCWSLVYIYLTFWACLWIPSEGNQDTLSLSERQREAQSLASYHPETGDVLKCTVKGDPHFKTFRGVDYEYEEKEGTYKLFELTDGSVTVSSTMHRREANGAASWNKAISVTFKANGVPKVVHFENNKVKINRIPLDSCWYASDVGRMLMLKDADNFDRVTEFLLTLPVGVSIHVSHSGDRVEISADASLSVAGLCGDMNHEHEARIRDDVCHYVRRFQVSA